MENEGFVDISNKWKWRESERESSFTWGVSRAGHVPAPCDATSLFGCTSDTMASAVVGG